MRYFQSVFLFFSLVIFLLITTGCESEIGPVELRFGDDADPIKLDHGQVHSLPVVDRQALLVMLDGNLDMSGEMSVELAEVYDAEVYVGPSDEIGDPHWITRGSVINAEGEPIWTQRVNSLFQLLEFLNVVIVELSPLSISVEQVFELAATEYPDLVQFPVKVPRHLDGGETYVLEIADDHGKWTELASYNIDELVAQSKPPAPDFHYEITPLVDNGPVHDRLNVAILGDGYTDAERHVFEADAQAVAERFIDTTPISEHANLFNIQSVWTPSEESGASYDCNFHGAPSNCEQRFRETVFETVFVLPALGDQYGFPSQDFSDRVAMPIQLGKIYEVAALAHYDEIILLSNSPKRSGFAGLYVAVVTNFDDRIDFPDVAVHEVGHTLGLLGDEYMAAGDACYFNEPTIPLPANIGLLQDQTVKWSDWIEGNVPLPTPDSLSFQHKVGAYEGAYNCEFLVRPSRDCKMNSSRDDFCPVCSEQMVRRFYSMVEPAPLQPATVELTSDNLLRLTVPVRDEERYGVTWIANGEIRAIDTAVLQLTHDDLSGKEWLEVTATVQNKTPFVGTPDQSVSSEFYFQVRLDE